MPLDARDLLTDAQPAPDSDALREVGELAARQIELEDAIEASEAQTKRLRDELAQVRDHELPTALSEHGLSEIAMADGSRVTVKEIVRATIPKKHQDEALAWLDEHGHGDLIKHEVKASFGRGEDEEAQTLVEMLRSEGIEPEDRRSVHAQTLSAFVREQLEKGTDLPRDLLGVFVGRQTKIERPKAPKPTRKGKSFGDYVPHGTDCD